MQNNTQQSSQAPLFNVRPPMHQMSRFQLPIAVLLIVVLGIVGFWVYRHKHPARPTYHYTQLSPYTYSGPLGQTGVGMTFLKPPEMKVNSNAKSNAFQTITHTAKGNSFVGMVGTFSGEVGADERNQFLSVTKGYFTQDVSSKNYQLATTGPRLLNSSWFTKINKDYQVTLGKAQAFTNPSITTNAWIFSLQVTDKSGVTQAKGEAIYALTNKGGYFFSLAANPPTWQANSRIWAQMLDSLKIDQ